MKILFFIVIVLFSICGYLLFLLNKEKKKTLTLKKFLSRISKTAKEVRYGNLSRRLRSSLTTETKSIALDINKMIEALNDREVMIKAYQAELESQKDELQDMVQMQEDFNATLTHDLKVPVLAEINTLKLFEQGQLGDINDNQKIAIQTMIKSNEELLFLINTLLDTFKQKSEDIEIHTADVCLVETINECLNEISFLIKEQSVSFNMEHKTLKACFDKIEIKRVIKNLLNNALTHTNKNGIIEISLEKDKKNVTVIVSDNGKGIAKEDIDSIFKKYFSKNKKFRKVGTGLGLYLSKQIIEKHKGEIWVESEVDKGARFFFTLPLN